MTLLITEIPKEIFDAAMVLGNYFARQDSRQWAVGEVCSRRWKEDIESELCRVRSKKTRPQEMRNLLLEIREWLTGGESDVSSIEIAQKINAVLQPKTVRR